MAKKRLKPKTFILENDGVFLPKNNAFHLYEEQMDKKALAPPDERYQAFMAGLRCACREMCCECGSEAVKKNDIWMHRVEDAGKKWFVYCKAHDIREEIDRIEEQELGEQK